MQGKHTIRIAILNLYEGQANQGMRCIRTIIDQFCRSNNLELELDEFEVRLERQLPDLSYDIYISTGGPGSPLESKHSEWEKKYFDWVQKTEDWNNHSSHKQKKFVFFICHSFQLACRHYKVAHVAKRKSTAFGVFPIHVLPAGKKEPVFNGMPDPFYAVDSRDYQVIEPDHQRLRELGAFVLCLEKERPHVPLERAVMGIRFNQYMIGTQFHPEADAVGMTMYLLRNDKKQMVIENHGFAKWQSMIEQLNDPDKISYTYSHVLPNFLNEAAGRLITVEA
ncbi:MAG TPA: GMP synthase [Chitinophagaceae bacterium]